MFFNPWPLLFEFWTSSLALSPMYGRQGDWQRAQREHAELLWGDFSERLIAFATPR